MSKTWYREKKKGTDLAPLYFTAEIYPLFWRNYIQGCIRGSTLFTSERKLDLDLFYFLFSSQLEETDIRRG